MKSIRFFLVLGALGFGLVGCGDDDGPTPTPDGGGPDSSVAGNTIVDIAVGNPDFSTLVGALQAAGLDDDLAGEGPFTVFAPTNAAFEALAAVPEGEALSQVLQYHVVSGAVRSTDLAEGINLPVSLNDLTLFVSRSGSSVTLNSGVTVTTADIVADNGIIHVIDAVLLPPSIADAAGHAGLTSLLDAATEAGPVESLGGVSVPELLSDPSSGLSFTVFAPANAAFDGLYAALEVDGPADLPDATLQGVLFYHVLLNQRVLSADVPDTARAAGPAPYLLSREGAERLGMNLFFDTTSGVAINGGSAGEGAFGANVVIADVRTTNGVVHVIDRVLLPPTIAQVASITPSLSSLVGAVGAAADIPGTPPVSVLAALDNRAPGTNLTVFAPTNDAFTAAASALEGASAEAVRDVLLYHVLGTAVISADLANGDVETLNGADVTVDADATPPTIEGAAVQAVDIVTVNGVVHVIDAVLLPPT
ncbi:MAG: fasciclin domain-containing protein [Sandaracinus sp.]|nr:fasciclin domain-containing protein [Sandaracinus sp.]